MDMAAAFATLANDGKRCNAWAVRRVEFANVPKDAPKAERVLYQHQPECEQVIKPEIAHLVTAMLQRVVCCGTGTAANIGRPVAGKTGTAQDYTNVYFAGYTPQVSTAVWVGFANGQIPMDIVLRRVGVRWNRGRADLARLHGQGDGGLPVKASRRPHRPRADRCPTSSACRSRRPRGSWRMRTSRRSARTCSRSSPPGRSSRRPRRRRPAPARERGDARRRATARASRSSSPPDGSSPKPRPCTSWRSVGWSPRSNTCRSTTGTWTGSSWTRSRSATARRSSTSARPSRSTSARSRATGGNGNGGNGNGSGNGNGNGGGTAAVAMASPALLPDSLLDACSSAQPARRSRTFCWTTEPSTLPLAEAITAPMTLPISCIEVAPVAEIASSISASTSASESCSGAKGWRTSRSASLLLGELGATGGLERLDRLGAPLDLLAGDLADLVVGELAHDLLLAVGDRGRQHAERAETDLLPGPQGRGHLLVHLDLQRGVAHVDSPPVFSRILLALAKHRRGVHRLRRRDRAPRVPARASRSRPSYRPTVRSRSRSCTCRICTSSPPIGASARSSPRSRGPTSPS